MSERRRPSGHDFQIPLEGLPESYFEFKKGAAIFPQWQKSGYAGQPFAARLHKPGQGNKLGIYVSLEPIHLYKGVDSWTLPANTIFEGYASQRTKKTA